jgi:ABC-type nitrate/sulfonate/bicarbonate transport system substrate-binding protein
MMWSAAAAAVLMLAASGMPGDAPAQGSRPKVTFAMPGVPPVFVNVQALVAQQEKFFEKYGVDVTLRPFDTGAAAARAVVAGDIEMSITPTALVVNMVSNANVDLVTVYGYEKPTWRLASMDPATKCGDLKGQAVAVDTPGGARSIALTQMLRSCNLTAEDTQQVGMSSNGPAALIAGQIKHAVLHLDEVPTVERESGKKVNLVVTLTDVSPVNHYTAVVTTRKRVSEQRGAIVGVIAGLIEATEFMSNPANAEKVAKAAAPTGRNPGDAKRALEDYLKMDFWPKNSHGLSQKNIDAVIAVQKKVGGIAAGKEPVSYERFADLSVYDEAVKLVRSKK